MMLNIMAGVAYGAFTGLFIAGAGYLKHKPLPDFDPSKFIQTLIVGGIAGGVMAFYGLDFDQALTWVANAGIVTYIEYVKKAIGKRIT